MLIDTNSQFSGTVASDGTRAPQLITATAISANVIDLRAPGTSPALVDEGTVDMYLNVLCTQAFNNLTTLTITLESDSAPGLATAPVVHLTQAVALAGLTAGAVLMRLQLPLTDYKRYLGLRYTVAGTAPTTGGVTAFLSLDPQRNVNYPSGFTIDV